MTSNSTLDFSPDVPKVGVSLWSSLLRMVVDRNPFYLLSAACMLGGCLAMTNSLSWNSMPLQRLLLLIGTINLYEAALIGLAIVLLGRGLFRDAKILLVVEAFFLVDVTFLNAEVVTASLHVGMVVAAVLLALALVKLRLVMYALGAELSTARFVYVMVQIAAMLAIPCVLRSVDHGSVAPLKFYVVWWIVGLMPVVGEVCRRVFGDSVDRVTGPAALYVGLPWISLIAHVGILHYVYDVDYFGAMAAPLLIGLTFVMNRANETAAVRKFELTVLKAMMPALAILVSSNNPRELVFAINWLSSAHISTTVVAALAAYFAYVYCFFITIAGWCVAGGALAMAIYLFGPSTQRMGHIAETLWNWLTDAIDWITPKTLGAWGVLCVIASFVFLIVGAAVSLMGRRLDLRANVVQPIPATPVKIDVMD